MEILFAGGLLFAVSVLAGLVFTIIGTFFGHIILFDSIFLAVISGLVANKVLHIHPAFSLLIGIAVLLSCSGYRTPVTAFGLSGAFSRSFGRFSLA